MSKKDVLKAYKNLHRIVQESFKGDIVALQEARKKINAEFKNNIELKDEVDVKIKLVKEVSNIIKTQVVQAEKHTDSNIYGLKIRNETTKLDNAIFKEDAILPPPRSKKC
ncbi:unnamed protein product [Diamesa serratosioi]